MKTRSLAVAVLTAVLLLGLLPGVAGAEGPSTQVCMLIDGSDSIDPGDFAVMLEGVASAVEDADCVPHDGSVELTVVQFSSDTTVEVAPVILTAGNAASVAGAIRGIEQKEENTDMADAFDACTAALTGSPNFGGATFQVINLSTDGVPTAPEPGAKQAAIDARDAAIVAGVDEIDAEAIGRETEPEWLRANIVYPQPGHFVDADGRIPGWVETPEDFEELAAGLCTKFQVIIPPPPEEFVPEPGSIILLASGLMGMAGYAGLRLRKK
jgi:hypothetical protein